MELENIKLIIELGAMLLVVLAAFAISIHYINKNKRLKHAHEVLRSQLEIQNQSFDNIYKEIHDNIGQALSLAKLNLHTVEPAVSDEATEKIKCTKDLVGRAISDLRDLSRSFSFDVIMKSGLNEAIKRELVLAGKAGRFKTNINHKGNPFRFDSQKELIIFRMFQETLNSISTYSESKSVTVTLEYMPRHFSLTICNDGIRTDTISVKSRETVLGAHIRNMQNRAILIGAAFQLKELIGRGNMILIDLPLA